LRIEEYHVLVDDKEAIEGSESAAGFQNSACI